MDRTAAKGLPFDCADGAFDISGGWLLHIIMSCPKGHNAPVI